jgi:RNA polymerase sigma-70 factor (ECF subfamily)
MEAASAEEFVRLFSLSQYRVLRFIHTLVPNLSEAEDILQDTSVILWRKWPEFDRDKDFVKWACGIARLEVFRTLREKKRARLYLSEAVLHQIADVALAETQDKARFEAGKSALEVCLQELPFAERQILTLRYREEKTVEQIAEACQRPKSTVHDILGKIRSRLLRCVRRRLAS